MRKIKARFAAVFGTSESQTAPSLISVRTFVIFGAINFSLLLLLMYVQVFQHPENNRGDFRAFWVAGKAAHVSPVRVYNWEDQIADQKRLLGDVERFLPFYHPPLELPLFAALAALPYNSAANLWRLISFGLLLPSGLLLSRTLGLNQNLSIVALYAVYPTYVCLMRAQDSILTLLLISATFYLLKNARDIEGGAVLSLVMLYKPQLPIVLAIALLVTGRKRFIAALITCCSALGIGALLYLRRDGIREFFRSARLGEATEPLYQTPTVRGLLCRFGGDHRTVALVVAIACIAVLIPIWRRCRSTEFVFSTAICAACILSLHMFAYDLVVLAIPVLVLLRNPLKRTAALIGILCIAPLYVLLTPFDMHYLMLFPTIWLGIECLRLGLDVSRTRHSCA